MSALKPNRKYYFNRKSMRLRGYDYSKSGFYFITIDCKNLECRFGNIVKGKMVLNAFGDVALNEWIKLPSRFESFRLNSFQIMPNHMHAIVCLISPNGALEDIKETPAVSDRKEARASPANTNLDDNFEKKVLAGLAPASFNSENSSALRRNINLSDIIGSYKSIVATICLEIHKQKYIGMAKMPLLGKIWKRGFYDHIIRDSASHKSIARYIRNNPRKWFHQ
jgi:REP element-mobilizing transposase RayT